MQSLRRWILTLLPALAATALLANGCGDKKPEGSGAPSKITSGTASDKATTGPAKELDVAGYTTLSGRVTYNGSVPPSVAMKKLDPKTDKDIESCPKEIPMEGWYTDKSSDKKGVQYTLVFLKPPKGSKLSKWAPELEKPDKEVVEMSQPRCQFEPRVLVLHPKQKVRFLNDSKPAIKHDANVSSTQYFRQAKNLNPGETVEDDPRPYDFEPVRVSCGQHAGTMSAYVWKMTHPYAVVTDADGKFELKHVPVPKGSDKMTLSVWHELLPGATKMKEIGPVDLEVGKPATKDVAIPN